MSLKRSRLFAFALSLLACALPTVSHTAEVCHDAASCAAWDRQFEFRVRPQCQTEWNTAKSKMFFTQNPNDGIGWAPSSYGLIERNDSTRIRRLLTERANLNHPTDLYKNCLLRARLRDLSGRDTAAPVSAPPTPPVLKLNTTRRAKLAPWSPHAMPIDPSAVLSPRFAAERADALAHCAAPMQEFASAPPTYTTGEANFVVEQQNLNDKSMTLTADVLRSHIASLEKRIAVGNLTERSRRGHRVSVCVYQRRLSQIEGSPLAPGALDGSLTPLSIGAAGTKLAQQGKDARIIASDGRSAMNCAFLEKIASGDSAISGGGRVLVNRCSNEVEFSWCYAPGDCDTETGSGWTVQPGKSWPVKAEGGIRWASCHGRDTASFVKGSHGLRYYCKAPAQK